MAETRLELLQDMPIFGGIRDDTLTFILELAPICSVPSGEFFFQQDEQGSSMFVIEEGRVSIVKRWEGRDYLLTQMEKGNCFGEMTLIDFCPRSASAQAVEDCVAIELTGETLHKLYDKDLNQFLMIQMNMAREVSRRLRFADEQLFRARAKADSVHGDFGSYWG